MSCQTIKQLDINKYRNLKVIEGLASAENLDYGVPWNSTTRKLETKLVLEVSYILCINDHASLEINYARL